MTAYAPHRTISIARQADYSASLQGLKALLDEAGHTVLDQCAAWTACHPAWDPKYSHGDRVLIGDRIVRFGTSVGYALANGDDPVAGLDRARHLRHETHWINLESSCLHSGAMIEHDILFRHRVGDRVTLEGRAFTIAPAPNRNFKLIEEIA